MKRIKIQFYAFKIQLTFGAVSNIFNLISQTVLRPMKNAQFRSSSRKAIIFTIGIHSVFRGLKLEPDTHEPLNPETLSPN
jgi:hypothetical protein